MTSYLDQILDATRERLSADRRRRSFGDLEREAGALPAPRDFIGAVREPGISLVAEMKRRSPSAGDVRPDADPRHLATRFEEGGARAVSVLTEPFFFSGSLGDLEVVRGACGLPVLRKDFVVDPYQVVEARAAGADAVLLIVAAVDGSTHLGELHAAAADYGLAALVEIHSEREMDVAFEAEPSLIGVNQRDLATFRVDRGLAARLRRHIPQDVAVIAESGISSRADVEELEEAAVDGILVGEALMRSDDPARAIAALLGRPVDAEEEEAEE